MLLLFALGHHRALRSVQSHLLADERLLSFLDDIYVVSQPERTCELYGILARELWVHSRMRINGGETQIWNRGGFILPVTMPSSQPLVRMTRMPRFGSVTMLFPFLSAGFGTPPG